MLVNGTQFCDLCNRAILVDECCFRKAIPKERAELFHSLFSITGNAMPLQVEPDGAVELAICLECKINVTGRPSEFLE
jgi:hypothetical protein